MLNFIRRELGTLGKSENEIEWIVLKLFFDSSAMRHGSGATVISDPVCDCRNHGLPVMQIVIHMYTHYPTIVDE